MDQARSRASAATPAQPEEIEALGAAVDAAETAISLHLPDGRCVAANDLVAQITGRPRSVMFGRFIGDVLVDGDPRTAARLFREIHADGVAQECFHTFVPGRGLRRLEVTACRSLIIGRRLIQVQWSDVTEQIREEEPRPRDDGVRRGETVSAAVSDLLHCRTPGEVMEALCDALDARAACFAAAPEGGRIALAPRRGIDLPSVKCADSVFEFLSDEARGRMASSLPHLTPDCPVLRDGEFTTARAVGAAGDGLVVVFDPGAEVSDDEARALLDGAAAALRVHALSCEVERLSRLTDWSDEVAHVARGVAHGINNDLTCILGNSFQLRAERPEDVSVTRHVDAIEESSTHAAKVASALQNLVRGSSHAPVEIDLESVVADAVSQVVGASSRTDIRIRVEDGVPAVRGDRHALQQAIVNLMQNAMDAIDGNGRIRVSVGRSGRGRESVELTVRDDGRGISGEHLPHVREPGFTTMAEASGRGLGLTIVDRIVGRHGGEMIIESVVGNGTTVRITIPSAG